MRTFYLSLVVAVCCTGAMAQTNAPVLRKLSIEDCIELALRHNFDVQIQRLNPEISQFNLNSLYGAYDPTFSIRGTHSSTAQPDSVDNNGRLIPGADIENNQFDGGFNGLLPWGLNYDLSMGLGHQTTTRSIITNTITDNNFSGEAGFLTLRQPLLKNFWIDSTRLSIYLNKKNLQISEQEFRRQLMVTITAVEQAYYNLVYSRDFVKVQEKALELAERLLTENKKRVEVGAMAPLDEKQAESQAATSRADLLQAQASAGTAERLLKGLLSDDYVEWHAVTVEPLEKLLAVPEEFDLQESWRSGLAKRPDILQGQLSIQKQGYVVKYQHNQLFPQLDAIGSAGYNGSSDTRSGYIDQISSRDNGFFSFGGQLSIPITRTTSRNEYKAAKTTKQQIELQYKQLQQRAMIIIEDSIANARIAFQRVKATHEASDFAEAALSAEQKKLESGKSTSFEVLRLQRDLTNARAAEIRALADYNISQANLALEDGTTLDRRHVNLEQYNNK